MLDLAPDIGSAVRDYAAREGVSPEAFTRRLLSNYTQQQISPNYGEQLVNQVRSAARAQDAQIAAVFVYINAPKEEIDRLHVPEIARFDAELAEAAQATPEETAAANTEWEAFKQRMNGYRATGGARSLFAESAPAGDI